MKADVESPIFICLAKSTFLDPRYTTNFFGNDQLVDLVKERIVKEAKEIYTEVPIG